MKITVLASGSSGNAFYLETLSAKILVDIGISFRQLQTRLGMKKENIKIDGLLITHEHSDHISGLGTFLGNIKCTVFSSQGTRVGINKAFKNSFSDIYFQETKQLEAFYIGNLKVTPFNISHDAREPQGFVFEEDGKKLVYITDTGYIDSKYFPLLKNADIYFFESNHDIGMLMNSSRPFMLKNRILSDLGHLSNVDSAANFCYIYGEKTKYLMLSHLSKECNTEELALKTYKEVFRDFDVTEKIDIIIAKQDEVVTLNYE